MEPYSSRFTNRSPSSTRNVGFYDVRHSLTEEKTPCAANFAAQAEAMTKERERIRRKVSDRSLLRNADFFGMVCRGAVA